MATASDLIAGLARTTDQVTTADELRTLLNADRPLRIKYGVDCTAPFLHIGHAVNLWMMRRLQDAGHRVIFLLGDVTTAVGDPTGRDQTRPALSTEQINANAAAFLDQVSAVLRTDDEVFTVRRNSEWFAAMPTPQWLSLLAQVTYGQLMARDMFRRRVAEGREIAMHELCYPVLQGFDSVALRSDLTIVGSDQLFNEILGRHLQQRHGQRPQVVITSTITPGIDGKAKQSKSLGNFIALTDDPRDKFGKIMRLPDSLVGEYMHVYTDLPMSAVDAAKAVSALGGTAARDAKVRLGHALVRRYHGPAVADAERDWFLRAFTRRDTPADLAVVAVTEGLSVVDLVRTVRPDLSGNETRRLVAQGGVRLDGRALVDADASITFADGAVLKVGKRHWFRLQSARP